MCKVYTGYHGTSEIEHSLCACTDDNPLSKARGLSFFTGAQTVLYLSLIECNITHVDIRNIKIVVYFLLCIRQYLL